MKDAGTFGISGMAGPGYVRLRELAKAASARKSKHPQGFRCHHTFRIGALISGRPQEILAELTHSCTLAGFNFEEFYYISPGSEIVARIDSTRRNCKSIGRALPRCANKSFEVLLILRRKSRINFDRR